MSELRELYQQIILDHNRAPRNFKVLENANRTADGHNPMCGDKLLVSLRVDEDDVIEDVAFQGSGCAISKASASLMTDAIKGKTVKEADALFGNFHKMVTGRDAAPDRGELGKLVAFAGVREFPARVKCAILSWHTMRAALTGSGGGVNTE